MADKETTLQTLRERLDREGDIDVTDAPVQLRLGEEGILTIEGEVQDLVSKKKTLHVAADTPGVRTVVDRLKVAAPAPMSDVQIRGHVRDAFVQEPVFAQAAVSVENDGGRNILKGVSEAVESIIEITVNGGVVTLKGLVPSLSHQRLAGVLAWWVPGTRDVRNELEVVPSEDDNDDELTDAVRMVLEKDRFVDASHVRVAVRNGAVGLEGVVPTEAARRMAERDVWFVLGVRDVDNRLKVVPPASEP